MVKIEFIRTEERYGAGNYNESEDVVVRPEQIFKDMDEAWEYAIKHGCNPWKNVRMINV